MSEDLQAFLADVVVYSMTTRLILTVVFLTSGAAVVAWEVGPNTSVNTVLLPDRSPGRT